MNLRPNVYRVVAIAVIAATAAGFALHAAGKPMDFRVYHYGVRGVFDGTRPVYGMSSGLGWPMHYRYPPLFLLLFTPFAWLPMGASAALWVVLKILILVFLVRALAARLPQYSGTAAWLIPLLLAGPFVVQDLRYGNAQFFVFSLTAFALLKHRTNPAISGALLALGIVIKVWPLFFVPYLLMKRNWKTAGWVVTFSLILTLLPSVYFGWSGNGLLLRTWFQQEFATQTGQDEIWFPSQSVRGVMMRYLTRIDYTQVPDSNYPAMNVASWDPDVVRTTALVLAAVLYLAFLWFVRGRSTGKDMVDVGIAFCLVGLLQPFTQKYALVILLWPAMVVSGFISKPVVRNLTMLSIGLVLIQPVIPGSAAQRWMQAAGFDFAATVALVSALAAVITLSPFRHISVIEK